MRTSSRPKPGVARRAAEIQHVIYFVGHYQKIVRTCKRQQLHTPLGGHGNG